MLSERVTRLREESLGATPTMSIERAEIVTDVYMRHQEKVSLPVLRALCFKALMERKTIVIYDGELIVGEKGHAAKSAPTFPELCCHTLEDFEVINQREKVFFRVDDETMRVQKDVVIPFWKGKSMRDKLFANVAPEWVDCYEAGIFTEFMEQRAPGHTAGGDLYYRKGFREIKADIEAKIAAVDYLGDPDAYDKREELKAMAVCCDAVIEYGRRHAKRLRELARSEQEPTRKAELEKMASVCSNVPENAPKTYWEALQMYWFVHLAVTTELNTWDAFNPGRLDQHLYPFYRRDIESGELTDEFARELLQCFWVKFNNQPAPPKVGITLAESGTYTDFCNINSGGLTPDGADGVNPVSYMVLDVIEEMKLVQPSSNIQLSRKNPDEFLKRACRVIREGRGQPSIFNADAVTAELVRMGKSVEDARSGGCSGCVEAGAFGKEAYILTGYFNLVKVFEITLNDGLDPRTGKQLGIKTGDPREFSSFDELFDAYSRQVRHFVDIKMAGNNIIERLYAKYMPAPFLSVVTEDCIENARDYNSGGARYNTRYIQGVGIGTITDSLAAVKKHVYEDGAVTMETLLEALSRDYDGHEKLRQVFLNKTPKYGNDDDYADSLMKRVFELYHASVDGRPGVMGGVYHIDMLPTTCHVYFGSVTGATPDGRHAGDVQSEGISPVQGADRNGPTSVVKSASRMDHIKTGGTLLNQKFTPSLLENEEGIANMAHLVRAYFQLDGHHIQFNVTSADTLRDAQAHPEKYRDLIVRVAGYSDYFNDLGEALQNEIITRTEHRSF